MLVKREGVAMDKLSFGFHAVSLVHHLHLPKYVFVNLDWSKTTDPRIIEIQQFIPMYISTWNMAVQVAFLALSLWLDVARAVCKSKEYLERLDRIRGYIFTTLLFPLTLSVYLSFWILYGINHDFVLPDTFLEIGPLWLNHSMHTSIIIVLIGELIITKKGFSTLDLKTATVILGTVELVFTLQFFLASYYFGRWMYGLFYYLTLSQAIFLMFGVNIPVTLLFMHIGFSIQRYKNNKYKLKV